MKEQRLPPPSGPIGIDGPSLTVEFGNVTVRRPSPICRQQLQAPSPGEDPGPQLGHGVLVAAGGEKSGEPVLGGLVAGIGEGAQFGQSGLVAASGYELEEPVLGGLVAAVGEGAQFGQSGLVAAFRIRAGRAGLGRAGCRRRRGSQLGQGGVVAAGGGEVRRAPDWACRLPA